MADRQYKTKITVQNDSVDMVGHTGGFYSPSDDVIYLRQGDITAEDFGIQTPSNIQHDADLVLIHERQHQINKHKGAYSHNVSLLEAYNRNVHDEITSLIAETLEIRRQYKACKTDAECQAVLDKFARKDEYKEYIQAIRDGKINPNSPSPNDFKAEMAFIKDSAIAYRADPNDSGYGGQWTSVAMQYLTENGNNARSNPEGFAEDVRKMYVIGGFDFNTVGNQNLMLLENQSIIAADNMLQQNVDPQKLRYFLKNDRENNLFTLAESLDISGLSREQAEKVILTAIVTQSNVELRITGNLCLGIEPEMYFNDTGWFREEIAPYLDLKRDLWEKSGVLTAAGDKEKFDQLMKQAQTVTLDPQAWFNTWHENLSKDLDIDEVKKRMAQYQGVTVNVNDVVPQSIMDKFALPFDHVSLESTLADMKRKEDDDAAFWEDYYKSHPEELQRRTSDPYEVEVMDLNSDILRDEFQTRKAEYKIESLYVSQTTANTSYGDGMNGAIRLPRYQNAQLLHQTAPDGTTIDVTLLNGQKHGAEITRDAQGKIIDIKAFNLGEEIDLAKTELKRKSKVINGVTHEYFTLNGQIFGTELIMDGKSTKVGFHAKGGMIIAGTATAAITRTETEFQVADNVSLKKELQAQRAEAPDSPVGTAQGMRFDIRQNGRQASSPDVLGRREPAPVDSLIPTQLKKGKER